ncbi:MAG TPA: hypothetical protein VK892_12650 [Pyrinomonadaceae bacterium]|nr:hypothetical protein [Pyrinomonadaceae bacterium]
MSIFSKTTKSYNLVFPLAVLFCLIIFSIKSAHANNQATYWILGNYNPEQKSLIAKAVGLAVTRMQNERLRRKLYEKNSFHYISNSVMNISNLIDTDKNRKNLLWHQLYWLSQPNGSNDTEPAFPNVKINMTNAPNGKWVGRARLDLVKVFWNSKVKEWQQSGEFNIELNSAFVGRKDIHFVYGETDYWAGTIAHEMLHNLGHTHGEYSSDKNYESYQINVFDRIIASNGYESKTLASSTFYGNSQVVLECGVK